MSETEESGAPKLVAEPVSQREFFTRAWQLGALMIGVGFSVWQLISVETSAIRRDVAVLQGKMDGVQQVLARIESRLDRIEVKLETMDKRLDNVEYRIEDIAGRVGAGAIGGPYKPKRR